MPVLSLPLPTPPPCAATSPAPYFLLRRTPGAPTLLHLILLDAHGQLGHWVMALPLYQLRRPPRRLLLVQAGPMPLDALEEVEEGEVRFEAQRPAACRRRVAEGQLRLTFLGQQLRGRFQLSRSAADATTWWLCAL